MAPQPEMASSPENLGKKRLDFSPGKEDHPNAYDEAKKSKEVVMH